MAITKTNLRLESINFLYDVGTLEAPKNPPVVNGIRASVSFEIVDEDGESLGHRTKQVNLWPDLTAPERAAMRTLLTRFKEITGAE